MKFSQFKEGVEILAKYVDPDEEYAFCAQNDVFQVGPPDLAIPDRTTVTDEDATRLTELGWFIEEENWTWAFYT